MVLSIGGVVSGLLAGIAADRYEPKSKMTKAYICMFGTLLEFLFVAIATIQTSNFWLSISFYALASLFSACFSGSAITMM